MLTLIQLKLKIKITNHMLQRQSSTKPQYYFKDQIDRVTV